MLEIDATILTPEVVLKASGHVEKFCDFMVKDVTTSDYYRADHLLVQTLEKMGADPKCTPERKAEYELVAKVAETYSKEELSDVFKRYEIKSPITGNELTSPTEFNLMFGTSIGPGNGIPG